MLDMNQERPFWYLHSCIKLMNSNRRRCLMRMELLQSLVLSDLVDLSDHSSSKRSRCELNDSLQLYLRDLDTEF